MHTKGNAVKKMQKPRTAPKSDETPGCALSLALQALDHRLMHRMHELWKNPSGMEKGQAGLDSETRKGPAFAFCIQTNLSLK